MENNEDQKNLYQNYNYASNYNSGINNINDPNVREYLNQVFLPQPYMPGQTSQNYNNNINSQNNQIKPELNNDYGFQRNILYISNLPYNTNETDIKLFFKKYGDSVTLMTINPRHFHESETAPISAKVIFKDPITANKARIEMNLRKLKGHAIRLMWEERDNSMRYNSTTNLFIKGIPFNVQPREVYEYFLKFGDISSAKMNEDLEGNHLGYGYVTYYDKQSAENAIKNTNGKMMWGGGPIQVDHFKKKSERISTSGPEVFKLYISNFPGEYTQNDIANLTKEYGNILSINISTEKVGRKYALVCYETEDSVMKAKESLEGKNIQGYNLLCKIMKDKSNLNDKNFKKNAPKNNFNKRFFQKPKPGLLNSQQHMCNLHIKNIPFNIKEKEFNEIFSKYGKIVSSKLEVYNLMVNIGDTYNPVPTSKGFGYVCYEDPEVAKKVKEELDQHFLPGYETWKHPLSINYFQSKSQKEMNNIMNMNYQNQNNLNNFQYNNNYIQNNSNNINNNNAGPEFSIEKFKNMSKDEDKQVYLGEFIFDYIFHINLLIDYPEEKQKEYYRKITGIILDIGPLDKVAEICQNKELLNKNITESLEMINKNKNE